MRVVEQQQCATVFRDSGFTVKVYAGFRIMFLTRFWFLNVKEPKINLDSQKSKLSNGVCQGVKRAMEA